MKQFKLPKLPFAIPKMTPLQVTPLPKTPSLLHITFISGVMLALILGGTLAVLASGGNTIVRTTEKESTFHRLLREYDFKSRQIFEEASDTLRRREFERLDSDLDRLEKEAKGVESWLSVLKRRRHLAKMDFRYESFYRESARRAAHAFPHSEPIAAIAAAALIHNSAITKENETYLREASPLLATPRFAPLRLDIHVLLGDFSSPERAQASLPGDFSSLEYIAASIPAALPAAEVILSDLAILKILAGDIPSAAIDIQAAMISFPSPLIIRLAAEYFYDFGDLVRSAELFSLLPDEADLSRQADALWLAGYDDSARTIWAILAGQNRALYNFALTAPSLEEEAMLLEALAGRRGADAADIDSRLFGLIRYSRLFEALPAIAILDAEKDDILGPVRALIDLEILKRRTEFAELPRMIAETWLLLDRHSGLEDLYEWGAWYFDLQRNYSESAKLLQIAGRHNFSGPWTQFYGALQRIRERDPDAAEEMLADVVATNGDWAAAANLARILETRRAPARALEYYERALTAFMEVDSADAVTIASRIQLRIALCLKTLGRPMESRRALEYAIDLNPDNINARLELSRLE